MPLFKEILQMPRCSYVVHVEWQDLHAWIDKGRGLRVDLNPEYQRGYVWTESQKINYVEYMLRGGSSGRDIFWNCPGWMSNFKGPLELVDGKQRLNAVFDFLDGKIPAFGHLFSGYTDRMRSSDNNLFFNVNNLTSRSAVIEWYISMNTGGSVHTEKDLKPAYEALERQTK